MYKIFMKKFFLFLLFVILLNCASIFICFKLGYIKQEDIQKVANVVLEKTKMNKKEIEKKVETTIQNTKEDIQEKIANQIAKQPKDVKIIATLGKEGWNNIPEYCENGADIFRINGSHIKNSKQMQDTIDGIKEFTKDNRCKNIDAMYDTQGPEIRILISENNSKKSKKNKKGKNIKKQNSYVIKNEDVLIIHTNLKDKEMNSFVETDGRKTIHVGVNYEDFIKDVKKNMIITIENRIVYARVEEIDLEKKTVKVMIIEVNTKDGTFKLSDRRHINLIGNPVSQETLTKADKEYIKMSAMNGVKYYAISFVRGKEDIQEVKNIIKQVFIEQNSKLSEEELNKKMKEIMVIAKIETKQGLDSLNDILTVADGAMVARGDLGAEIPMEEVPYATSKIITSCKNLNKFSILATDVLLSLTQQDMVSRNDIYVISSTLNLGVDSIMLSNETAQGDKGNKAIAELKKHIDYYNKRKINKDYL